jgi:hypothetical protein
LHAPSRSYDAQILNSQIRSPFQEYEFENEREMALLNTPLRHRVPKKVLAVALLLDLVGLIFLLISILHFATGISSSFGFFLFGALLLMPGGVKTFQIIHFLRGIEGYEEAIQ